MVLDGFWKDFERILKGIGKDLGPIWGLGRVWKDLERILEGFGKDCEGFLIWKDLGRILGCGFLEGFCEDLIRCWMDLGFWKGFGRPLNLQGF